jgi:hypothetical protein
MSTDDLDAGFPPEIQALREALDPEHLDALEGFFYKVDVEGVSYAIENYLPDELADHPEKVIDDLYGAAIEVQLALASFRMNADRVRALYGIEVS